MDKKFNVVSLGHWMTVVRQSDIAHVPARRIGSLRIADMWAFDSEDEAVHRRLGEGIEHAQRQILPDEMFRWDICAPLDLKAVMSEGMPSIKPTIPMVLDDPRLIDILVEMPEGMHDIDIWARPWMRPLVVRGYPAEYRAYVHDGKVVGISSYYPQRPLRFVRSEVRQVHEMTQKLLDELSGAEFDYPGHLYNPVWDADNPPAASFTADFMTMPNGRMLFLEGGPPFGMGAHPCCFEPNDPNEAVSVDGLALVKGERELPRLV